MKIKLTVEKPHKLSPFFKTGLILCCLAIGFLWTAQAQAGALPNPLFKISQPEDSRMDCPEISSEISDMDTIILVAEDNIQETKIAGTGIGVAQTVGSFMIGSLGGVLGIFAAGAVIDNAADNKIEKIQEIQSAAEQRRSLMAAMYDVKQCVGPLAKELSLIEPAAGTALKNNDFIGPPDLRPHKINYND